jgi:NADH-quinone oxidoreductase subunit K
MLAGAQETYCMNPMHYLGFSSTLFLLGVWGIFLNRKNIIVMLMSIELMLLAVNFNFLVFSVYVDDLLGQVFSLFILTVAAAESAIGLALLVIYYRARGTVAVEFINLMKG